MKYEKLRAMIDKTLVFEFDTGVKIVGILKEVKPEEGAVKLAVMKDVDILSETGDLIEHHSTFTFVPNKQKKFGIKKE